MSGAIIAACQITLPQTPSTHNETTRQNETRRSFSADHHIGRCLLDAAASSPASAAANAGSRSAATAADATAARSGRTC